MLLVCFVCVEVSGCQEVFVCTQTWWLVPAQSCDKELWQRIMAAVGAQAGLPAGLANEALGQVFQVLVRMHAYPSAEFVTVWPPCLECPGMGQELPSSA